MMDFRLALAELLQPDLVDLKADRIERALASYNAKVRDHCAIAFPLGFRVALRMIPVEPAEFTLAGPWTDTIAWEHIMLAPGESPPDWARGAWTIYEERGGLPVGRSR